MNDQKLQQLIKSLQTKLKKWASYYYQKNQPLVDDQTYDQTYQQLVELEKKYPHLVSLDSITQKVGAKVSRKFQKVKHQFPMLSLNNAFDFDDLNRFDQHIKNQLATMSPIEYTCEFKIDGLSISLIYQNGLLIHALTRGDGVVGEDVILNALKIKDIKSKIDYKKTIEFRGEVYMSLSQFQNLNQNSSQKFKNPRNAAAGTLRQLDSSIVGERNLSAFFYAIPDAQNHDLKTQKEILEFIKKQGLPVEKNWKFARDIENVKKVINDLDLLIPKLNYGVDGVVVKVNRLNLYEDIGQTIKYPKYMIAYKFAEKIGSTKLLDIFPTVGRTGKITYNATLEPIELEGTIVVSALLHNADYVKMRQINVGDIVLIKKSGSIIPRILGLSHKNNFKVWTPASFCPSCHNKLVKIETEVDQYCLNLNCPQRILASLEHFVSRQALDVVGLSTKRLELFLEKGLIYDLASIFDLPNKRKQLLNLDHFQEKSVDNLISAIQNSQNCTLDRFIFALGIRHVGIKVAKILAKRFGSLEKIIDLQASNIEHILTLGSVVANSIVTFFENDNNLKMIQKMLNLGLKIKESFSNQKTIFENQTFVITGVLNFSRDHYINLIENNGGNVSNSVSRNTTYLLVGENAGSKLLKAQKLEVKIINEDQFQKMLEVQND